MVRAQVGTERRRLRGARKSPAEVNTAVKAFADFYDLYHDEWDDSRAGCRAASGVDEPLVRTPRRGATGSPAVFYQQLQGLNLGEVWQNLKAPVLVIRGSADSVRSRAGAESIVQTVNQIHPETPGLSKSMT